MRLFEKRTTDRKIYPFFKGYVSSKENDFINHFILLKKQNSFFIINYNFIIIFYYFYYLDQGIQILFLIHRIKKSAIIKIN